MNPPPPGNPPKHQQPPPPRDETPISKYLANLEKRKSIFHPRTSPKVKSGMEGVTLRLNFDDTFCGSAADQSLLQSSPTQPLQLLSSSVFKKRRTSFFAPHTEDEDPEVYRTRICDLEKLLRQTQAELIDCRTSYSKMEQANNIAKRSFAERQISFEQREAESKAKLKEADEKVTLLGTKLEQSLNRELELSSNLRQQREAYNNKYINMEQQLTALNKENADLRQKLSQEGLEAEKALNKLKSEYNETEQGVEKWIVDSQIYQEQLKLAHEQLEKCRAELKKSQMEAVKFQETVALSSNIELEALEERVRKFENLFVKEQATTFGLTKSLEKVSAENAILRSTIREEMILHEEITSLKNQMGFLRQEVAEKGKAEAERDAVKSELQTLKDIISALDYNCSTPLAFQSSLRQSQALLLDLKHENSTLKLDLENSVRNSTNLQNELSSLRNQLRNFKEDNDKLSAETKKLTRRMSLLVKDRDGLKDLKESYEQEFEAQISEPLITRISNLEEVIAGYETLLNDDRNRKCPECDANKTLVENLKTELEAAHRQNETLLSQTMQCTQDDGTVGYKIVSLANNPSMISIESRLKECLKENEELKEKLRNFEEDTLAVPSNGAAMIEKKKLEEDLRALERKHEILTEAYDYETVQLQQACIKLFGFYVTLIREPQSQIRLQSVSATGSEDFFIFQEAENHDMMLLETPVLDHFREDIDRFLMREGSIPAFLASVTITYLQEGGPFSQSSSQGHAPVPFSSSGGPSGSQPTDEPATRGGIEMIDHSESEHESSGAEDEEEEVEYDEDEEDDPEPDDHGPDPDDDDDEEDDDSDEEEDVIMIDSD